MKRWLALGLAAVAPVAWAQVQLGGPISQAYRLGVSLGKFKVETPRPTEAPGFAPNNPTAPLPEPQGAPGDFELVDYGHSHFKGTQVRADEKVHFRFRGYEVWCDFVDGDTSTEVFDLEGNVRIVGKGQEITGQKVRARFKERIVEYLGGTARVAKGALGPKLQSDLYLRGDSLGGTSKHLVGEHLDATTCELPHPHFNLRSKNVDIKPNKWMVLKDTTLNVLGRDLFKLPYLIFPLQERSDRYLPTVGKSQDEGYYVLSKWPIALRGDSYLDQRVDLFSELGMGLGGDYHYKQGRAEGLARLYRIFGRAKSQLLSLDHAQQLGGGNFRINSVYQNNNYLTAPNTSTFTINTSYGVTGKRSSTRIGFTEYSSKTATFDSLTSNLALNDTRTFSKRLKTNLDFNLADNSSSGISSSVRRRQFDVRFRASYSGEDLDSEFAYLRSVPIGTQKNFFSTTDRTPMFTIRTDARKLMSEGVSKNFPWRLEASIGELADFGSKSRMTRTYLDWGMSNSSTAQNGTGWNYDTRIKQGVYSDGTAQYVLSEDIGYKYQFRPRSYIQMRHSLIEPHGYTPLSLDRSANQNFAYVDAHYESNSGLLFGVQSGYDFLAHDRLTQPWQTVGLRLDYSRGKSFYIRNNATFDTFRSRWGDLRTDMGVKALGGYFIVGSRYDSLRNKFGNLNVFAEGLTFGRLKLSALLNYNGYTKRFDSQQLSATWDLHCAEAYVQVVNNQTGFRRGAEIGFGVRIKGLPFDTGFGAGRRGNAIGTGTGGGF